MRPAIDAAYFSEAELALCGKDLAESGRAALPGYSGFDFSVRQAENREAIAAVYRANLAAAEAGQLVSPAAEWLLDNFYLVEENSSQVRRDLPKRFYRNLPSVPTAQGEQVPRSLALAWLYAAHSHCEVTAARLTAIVQGHQALETLRIGELWAIPSILRFVLIEDLARLALRIERARLMRAKANSVADLLLQPDAPADSGEVLEAHEADAADDAFASQLLYRLRDGSVRTHAAVAWLERLLEARQSDAEEVLIAEQNRLSAGNVRIGNIVRSLRTIDDIDWMKWFASVSAVDALLRDHANYAELDFTSQDQYRGAVEQVSRWSGKGELEVARKALDLRAEAGGPEGQPDVGVYLVGPGRRALEHATGSRVPLTIRLGRAWLGIGLGAIALPIGLLTLGIVAGCFGLLSMAGVGGPAAVLLSLLAVLPASEAATGLFNTIAVAIKAPARLVGFEYKDGLPRSARTLVVVPCLITSHDTIDELVRTLEVHHLSNTGGEIYFALLSDWPDSPQEVSAADTELLEYARAEVAALAARYAHDGATRFFLLHRARLFNPSEGVWMGWERKRGKLMELNTLLRGGDTTFLPADPAPPDDIAYVMTLDADTRLRRDAVTRLVGKLAHPLNHPVVDAAAGRIVSGNGILQPRVSPSLTTGAEASAFQRIFSVNRGFDPYAFTVSDVYQDLTGEGGFTGKGLYHVDAVRAALDDRIPEDAILSHDLLEGSLARSALASDVELVEDFPVRYENEAARQHRWARGDWQLLPYVTGRLRGAGAIGRWKMLDNLRRTLVPIAWVLASVCGWCVLGAAAAATWQAFLIVSLCLAPLLDLIRGAFAAPEGTVRRAQLRSIAVEAAGTGAQVLLRVVFMADSAAGMTDAILRTLYRVNVSRRHLLEWRSAASVGSEGTLSLREDAWNMKWAVVIGGAALAMAVAAGTGAVIVAAPVAGLWIVSPLIAWWVSRSAETEDRLDVAPADRDALRRVGRRTWAYFEHFVTAEHHWLPPDNFQEDPEPVVAGRTSPTNIGLYLLSVVSAHDFGWIGTAETIARLEDTMAAVDRLERFRGHICNWIDTRNLSTLTPKYVSTVDSGNLAGHLIAASATCGAWADGPSAPVKGGVEGISDVAGILSEELASVPDDRRALRALRHRLDERIEGFNRMMHSLAATPELVSVRVINLAVIGRDVEKLARELDSATETEQSRSVVAWAGKLVRSCESAFSDATLTGGQTDEFRSRLRALRDRMRALAFGMDFAFLMRKERRLLAIGYRIDEAELDDACYDLLASEARLTSFFGIAKGDLPTEHWFRLGRPIVPVHAQGALASWAGSMFEYLMPPLVMQERQGSILNQTNTLAVQRQIEYGRLRQIPWGISESAFNARDREMTYQYSTFGVPSLGIKRGLANDAVVAPYATILASQYRPRAAIENLARLAGLGARGAYGFYDAVDFTPARLPENVGHVVVRNFMAHHHGMSILAVANVVFHGQLRERFHSDPVIEAAQLLLQERAPRAVPMLVARTGADPIRGRSELTAAEHRIIEDPATRDQAVALLSNGHYSLMLSARGSGHASWNGLAVTRWRADAVEGGWGTFLFLRDMAGGDWWSATADPRRPAGDGDAVVHAVFSDSKVEFHKTVGDLRSEVDVIVSSGRDAEGRRLTIFNTGSTERLIEVTSYAEPVLANAEADSAHPAFSKMFLRTEIDASGAVIHADRNPRGANEPDMRVAHLLVDGGQGTGAVSAETDRRRFIGRGRTLGTAAAFDAGAALSGADGFTLDPIFALRKVVRVPARGQASLIFWTVAAPSRAEIDEAVGYFAHRESFAHEGVQAWTRSQIQLRHFGTPPSEAAVFQKVARYLVYPGGALRTGSEARAVAPQSALWPMGISGDVPIVLLRIDAEADLAIARKALRAQEYFRSRGLMSDLVFVNEQASSYAQDLQNAIEALCENARLRGLVSAPRPHIFALRRDRIGEAAYAAVLAVARVSLHARNGTFSIQIDRAETQAEAQASVAEATSPNPGLQSRRVWSLRGRPFRQRPAQAAPRQDLAFWNGYGGFAPGGREYVVRLGPGEATPQPWINVVANPGFGFHVSAEGAAFTWSANSRDHHLTPWSNDPVTNRTGEALFVVDRVSGQVFTPFAALASGGDARFEARHGPGYSAFSCEDGDLALEARLSVDPQDPVRLTRLTVTNRGRTPRNLRVYGYVEWVLGNNRDRTAPFVSSTYDPRTGVVTACNPYAVEYAGRVAFFCCDAPLSSATADRAAFLGDGSIYRPEAVASAAGLHWNAVASGDPCAALATDLDLAPGESRDLVFALGDGASAEAAAALAERHRGISFADRTARVAGDWDAFLDVLQIETPDPAMNVLVNTWLPYQTLACRLRARSGFYQASGAFGFRDQLQDTLALLLHDPGLARAQILNAAGRQFVEGDVQHWWLPATGAGVRTTISDDVVWLGHATAHYIAVTGDAALLEEKRPFVTGPTLGPGQHDAFYVPDVTRRTASVYEHCARGLDLAVTRTGANGLSLMLGGDWNDGMNRVGEAGRGESVWLSWFLAQTLGAFLPLAEARGDEVRAGRWRNHLAALGTALEGPGWDGRNYRRGFYDDGTPLGSVESDECRIDSIAQSWSVLSARGDPVRQGQAMDRVMQELVDREARIVKLFTPPFEHTDKEPGYIKGYPPGVRENGGQYTHAATWVVYALAELGRGDEAHACFEMLNPITRSRNRAEAEAYRVEPYVVAADVYSVGDQLGRGGWTWYTGSSGWLYRAAVEAILGIRKRGDLLQVTPALPSGWEGYRARLRLAGRTIAIEVRRSSQGGYDVLVDGASIDGGTGYAIAPGGSRGLAGSA